MTTKTCVRHPRISGGVAVLLKHLNAWLREHRQGPLTMDDFVAVLRDEKLEVREVAGTLIVTGFGLREDLLIYRSELIEATRKDR